MAKVCCNNQWLALPVNEEQLRESIGANVSLEVCYAQKVMVYDQEYDLPEGAYNLDKIDRFYRAVLVNSDVSKRTFEAFVELYGIERIEHFLDVALYDSAEEFLETLLTNDDRIKQASNGVIIEEF
ncbi:hypothetical protein [Streptococcus hyointestinalis]|nr:hypothetical protein [Streptococcus hyointestinalis]